jgi:hypothetical protein
MLCCSNCGYSCHISHDSRYCLTCGTKLVVGDSRSVCPESRQRAYDEYIRAKNNFEKEGGNIN